MTLKESIASELLAAASNPGELQEVFQRYGQSKGPFYLALAEATVKLRGTVEKLCKEKTETEAQLENLRTQVDSLDQKRTKLDATVQSLDQQATQLKKRLVSAQSLLDEAQELAKQGFSADQLARFRDVLARLAASQGTRLQNGVEQFFEAVGHYEQFVSLDVEVRQAEVARDTAKAEVERWQAEARATEAKAKAQKASIDFTEKLLAQGVKEPDLPHWTRILAKAGVTPETLAQALEQHMSLAALLHDRQTRADALKGQVAKLERQVKALTDELEGVRSTIQAMRDTALATVQQAMQDMVAEVRAMENRLGEFGSLREELGDLQAEVTLARALRSGDPDTWRTAHAQHMLTLLVVTLTWAQANGFNPELVPPENVQSSTTISSWTRVRFCDLLRWAAAGLVGVKQIALSKGSLP